MDLQDAVDRLYSGAPEDFVATRAGLVKQARADGDRETAAGIAALRRPTAAAALLNALARANPDAIAALSAIGDELRDAQKRGDGDAIRTLGAKRRKVIGSTVAAVAELAADRGAALGDSVRGEVEASLAAAILDPASAAQLGAGALTGALQEVGFGDWSPAAAVGTRGGATGAPSRPALRAVPDLPPKAAPTSKGPTRAEQKAERERADRERVTSRQAGALARAEKATAALEAAQERAGATQERVDRLHEQIDQLREELAAATTDARQAHEAQRKATRDAAAAMRRLSPGDA